MRMNRISRPVNILLNLFFMTTVVFCIYPLLLVLSVSLSDEKSLVMQGYSIIPARFSLLAYQYVFNMAESVLGAYGITILVTVAGTCLSVLITCLYAYPISRREFAYRRGFTFFLFLTMIFSGGMVPWYIVCVQFLHINNSILGLILPYLISGFNVIVMRTFYVTTIPDSLIESAKIDGYGEFRIFFRIVLPLSLPGLATIALFVSIGYWNDWWLPLMLVTDDKLYNIQFLLYRVINQLTYLKSMAGSSSSAAIMGVVDMSKIPGESVRMALCIISIGPIILAYPFFQRFFIKGLTIGAIKG
jgi:putative aldouronate transport system permease protein